MKKSVRKIGMIGLVMAGVIYPTFRHDGRLWDVVSVKGAFDAEKKILYTLHFEGRFRYHETFFDENIDRCALGYQVTPDCSVWLGYDFIPTYSSSTCSVLYRQALWQQVSCMVYERERLAISARTRLQERMQLGAPGVAWRLRQRVKLKYKKGFSESVSPVVYDELFFNLNTTDWVSFTGFSQNRLFIGVSIASYDNGTWDIGYLNQIKKSLSGSDSMNHCIFVGLTIKR